MALCRCTMKTLCLPCSIARTKSKISKSGIKKLHGYEKDLKTPVIELWKLSTQTPVKLNQVPYHLLTSAERKNPRLFKSKIDRRPELEKLRQEHAANLELKKKKKDAASAAKMTLKPIMVSLKVCMSLIVKKHHFYTLNLFLSKCRLCFLVS